MSAVGGPWRARGFDPRAWQPPARAVAVDNDSPGRDSSMRWVVGYVVAVLVSCAALLLLLERGWLPGLF